MDLLVYIILLYNPRESNKYSDHKTVAKIRGFHQENESGNEYPLIPHFYISKTGVWRGIYLFFLFLLQNIDGGYSLKPPRLDHLSSTIS